MTDLEIIRKACVKANPSIMDLVFGCEIKLDNKKNAVLYYEKGGSSFDGENTEYYEGALCLYSEEGEFLTYGDESEYKMPKINDIEILGRPIRLADVLLAVGFKTKKMNYFHSVDKEDHLCLGNWVDTVRWNLRKDSLTDQSPETINFLAEILK